MGKVVLVWGPRHDFVFVLLQDVNYLLNPAQYRRVWENLYS